MKKTHDQDLTAGPIPGLIRGIAVPASVGYFFNTMYNVVDTYFGGLVSTDALAALSLSLPVFFIIVALGTGLATGSTALIGSALGGKDREQAGLLARQAVTFGLLTGIALTFFGLWVSPYLFRILGASGEYLTIALTYMNTIFWGSIFFILIQMFNSILNAQGNTRTFRNFLIFGFLMNVGLDPWFIYGGFGLPAMGFMGIALATVLIHVVGVFYLGYRVHKTGIMIRPTWRSFIPDVRAFKDIARQGFPASLNMATIGLGIFVITYFVSKFGQDGVAAYGAAMRVEQIVLLPTIGLNVATLAVVAQNYGAGQFDRIFETIRVSLIWGGIIMAGGTVLVFALSGLLMGLFSKDTAVIAIGAAYLKIDALVLYAYVVLFVHIASLQGVKRPMYAVWIGLSRQIIAPAIVFYLFSQVFGWGLLGIWWGIFLVTWSAALFTAWFARRKLESIRRA